MGARLSRLTSQEHRDLAGSGVRGSSGPVTAHLYRATGSPSLGMSISSRVGGAVVRNRIRRRLRSACASATWSGPLVLSARADAAKIDFPELVEHVSRAIARAAERINKVGTTLVEASA